jgi:hypothetical protein
VRLPLDADPLVVNAGLVLLVLDEAVLAMRLVPLVVLNMVPSNRNQLSYIQCCGSGMLIPDSTFFHPDPGSASKNLSILTPKKWFLSSRKYDRVGHPGSGC